MNPYPTNVTVATKTKNAKQSQFSSPDDGRPFRSKLRSKANFPSPAGARTLLSIWLRSSDRQLHRRPCRPGERARQVGLEAVMDRCVKIERFHQYAGTADS